MLSTRTIHRLMPLALVVGFAAFAAPALADPPQLRIDTPAHVVAPDGWAAQYADRGSPAVRLGAPDGYTPARLGGRDDYRLAHVVAPDGWAAQYADGESAAGGHPDNRTRFVGLELASGAASDIGSGFGWRAGVLGVLAFGLALATVGTLVIRMRARLVRA